MDKNMECKCVGCDRRPCEIDEYILEAEAEGIYAEEYVQREEGTYNRYNGHFTCTHCYLMMGMPSEDGGWKAP